MMGKILEKVRQKTSMPNPSNENQEVASAAGKEENVPLKGNTSHNQSNSIRESQRQTRKITVITDSILCDVDKELCKHADMEVSMYTFGGHTAEQILDKTGESLAGECPDIVILHCGTNDTERNPRNKFEETIHKLLNEIMWHASDTKIILSRITHRLDKPSLNSRIDNLNAFLESLQSEIITYVDHNSTFRDLNRILDNRGLHLRNAGKKQVAENLYLTMIGKPITWVKATEKNKGWGSSNGQSGKSYMAGEDKHGGGESRSDNYKSSHKHRSWPERAHHGRSTNIRMPQTQQPVVSIRTPSFNPHVVSSHQPAWSHPQSVYRATFDPMQPYEQNSLSSHSVQNYEYPNNLQGQSYNNQHAPIYPAYIPSNQPLAA